MPADPSLLSALVEALKKDPQSTPLRLHVANLLLESGAEEAALDHFTTVLANEPANRDALDGAARAADALGDSARAQGYWQLLEALGKPSKPTPTKPSTKRWKEAETHCRRALRIEARSWAVMNNLGVALQGQGRHKEAVAAFENAAKLNPKPELVRRNLFSQTQRYIGISFITILIVQGIRLVILAHARPLPLIVGLAILLLGAWVIYRFASGN